MRVGDPLFASVLSFAWRLSLTHKFVEEEESMSGGVSLGGSAYLQRRISDEVGVDRQAKILKKTGKHRDLSHSLGGTPRIHIFFEVWDRSRRSRCCDNARSDAVAELYSG